MKRRPPPDLPSDQTPEYVCPRCLALIVQIRRGELKGAVLSCHPLDQIADLMMKPYIETKSMN